MKVTTISVFQKFIVLVLATLMFFTMVPVGLFPGNNKPSAEGSFDRYYPHKEVYTSTGDSRTRLVDRNNSVYFKFGIGNLQDMKEDEIKEITLRIAFLKGSGERNNVIYISKVSPQNVPENPKEINIIKNNENQIARIIPNTFAAEDCLFEADLTDYVKEMIEEGAGEIAIKVSSDNKIPVFMASTEYLDVAYRPCLKVVTGIAEDTDADTLKKAELSEAVYVSENEENETGKNLAERNGELLIGEGNETYLRFNLNKGAIVGSLYNARILLKLKDESQTSNIKVYSINNDQWSGDTIRYSDRPRGEEKTLTYAKAEDGAMAIDVTQQVCEAVNNGMYDITFRLVSVDGNLVSVAGANNDAKKPQLSLKATDDKHIVCASEAALNALGDNKDIYVTMDLTNSYKASNGERAKIRWSEYSDGEVSDDVPQYINKYGEITRPRWFENTVKTLVMAEIESGDFVTKRRYELSLPPEKKPDYTGYKFGDYIDIGDNKSEEKQKFEYVNMSGIKRRWVDGKIFSYRSLEKNNAMVLNMECSPYEVNYLTIKLWRGEYSSPQKICIKPYGYKGEGMKVEIPELEDDGEGVALYMTYALPEEYTKGLRNVSLCVSFEGFDDVQSRGIYGAFMTQNPYFEPRQFADQGEDIAGENSFAEEGIRRFRENLRNMFGKENNEEASVESTSVDVIADIENKTVMLANKELNIAVKKNEDGGNMSIYHRTAYFDRYCADCEYEIKDALRIISFGAYRIFINSDREKEYSLGEIGLSGMYKDISKGEYYSFSDRNETTDDSSVPEGKPVLDGKELAVSPEGGIILKQISEPASKGDWRVTGINGKSVSDITFSDIEKIDVVSVKAIDGVNEETQVIRVICEVYENGKLMGIGKTETNVFDSTSRYNISFADKNLYMNKNRSIRIFIAEEGESMNKILPKLEFPMQ